MVTVGTWNLENLFRPGSDAGPDSDAVYEAKLMALAETITTLAPDVLAVQEVGEPDALADLVDRLGGAWHTALADPDGRGIRVLATEYGISQFEALRQAIQMRNRMMWALRGTPCTDKKRDKRTSVAISSRA